MKIPALFVAVAISGFAADWNPKLAAQYLDGRQKDWFAWKQAQSADGPCVSCHTGLTYLLARPALRRMLHEKEPTMYETGLLNRLRAKAGEKPPGTLQGVETIFAAMFLAREDKGKPAFEQLWTLQNKDGPLKGAFPWYNANLDPWETPAAFYFGAALGAVAVGHAPAEYRNQPEIRERIHSLADYLGGPLEGQPLHSSVAWLWASSALPEVAAAPRRLFIIDQVFAQQSSDGAWTLESLGPFDAHADAPPSSGGSAYATGLVTFVLGQAGVPPNDKRLIRARDWLKANQDRTTGAWAGVSMNKRFPADSMQSKFMQDAATGYAVLALAGAGEPVAGAQAASEYQRSIEKWRADRETALKADNGWLTVVGLEWLKEGANSIDRVGVVTVKDGKAWRGSQELLPDSSGKPTVVTLGRTNFQVIEREGKLGVRLKDNDSPARQHFTGLKWYPVDASWHVRAKFVKWPAAKTIVFDTAVGVKEPMQSPGYVAFQRDGKEYRLEPVEEDGELFFVMRDATSGKATYAASRFLYAPLPKDGFVDLDFNKAENPPCVFTDYATCPLPPPQNRLTVAVTAGELIYKH